MDETDGGGVRSVLSPSVRVGGGHPCERGVGLCPWVCGAFLCASDGVCLLPRYLREAVAVSLHLSVCAFPRLSLCEALPPRRGSLCIFCPCASVPGVTLQAQV